MRACPANRTALGNRSNRPRTAIRRAAPRAKHYSPKRSTLFLIVLLAFAGTTGCRQLAQNDSNANQQPAAKNGSSNQEIFGDIAEKIPVVQLDPKTDRALRRNVTKLLETWKTSIEKRDLKIYLDCYADAVETFYLQRNVDKAAIKAEYERAFGEFETIRLQLNNVDIKPTATDAAAVVLDKDWEFQNTTRRSAGTVQQLFNVRKINRRWFIVGERDWRVYRSENQKLQPEINVNQ